MKILKLALFLAVVAGLSGAALSSVYETVSYTHLDVYKRQLLDK